MEVEWTACPFSQLNVLAGFESCLVARREFVCLFCDFSFVVGVACEVMCFACAR